MHDNQMLPSPAAKPVAMDSNLDEEDKNDTPFQTPDEIAAGDQQNPNDSSSGPDQSTDSDQTPPPPKRKWWQIDWRHFEWPPTKRQIIISAVIIVLVASGVVAFALTRPSPPPTPVIKPMPIPKPIVIKSPLTGLPVTAAEAKLPVTGVMIENSLPARPQSGLGSAGVVFEAIAEGGITRFLALYQEAQPKNVGPIRSARPYFVRWAQGFDAGYAHVGGSPEALQDIRSWHVRDLDQFFNAGYYHRVSSRYAPHNVYTSLTKLHQLEKAKGYSHSKFTGFKRKEDQPSKKPTAANIGFNISRADFNVHYTYNPKIDAYLRSEGGKTHVDANSGKPIYAKVVIAIIMPYSLEADGYHSSYSNIGSGPAYIFQDGTVKKATWSKKSNTAPLTFTVGGDPVKLNAGSTWITALKSPSEVSYQPAKVPKTPKR